jgi:hypothetical protein
MKIIDKRESTGRNVLAINIPANTVFSGRIQDTEPRIYLRVYDGLVDLKDGSQKVFNLSEPSNRRMVIVAEFVPLKVELVVLGELHTTYQTTRRVQMAPGSGGWNREWD